MVYNDAFLLRYQSACLTYGEGSLLPFLANTFVLKDLKCNYKVNYKHSDVIKL